MPTPTDTSRDIYALFLAREAAGRCMWCGTHKDAHPPNGKHIPNLLSLDAQHYLERVVDRARDTDSSRAAGAPEMDGFAGQ